MITVLGKGTYRITEAKSGNKILSLGGKTYAWSMNDGLGIVELTSHKPVGSDHVLAAGIFRLYVVSDEAKLTDSTHLELNLGNWIWLGYLLPRGLPKKNADKLPVLTTNEVISRKHNKEKLEEAV